MKPTGERKRGLVSKKKEQYSSVCIWLESIGFSNVCIYGMSHQFLLSGLTGTVKADFSGLAMCTVQCTEEATCTTEATRALSILLLDIYVCNQMMHQHRA